MPEPRDLRVGVDSDNTIVNYDALFYRCALDRKLIPQALPPTKSAVREYLWGLPDGNTPWTELQAVVYGERILEAVPCEGVTEFFRFCGGSGIPLAIISHKMEYPALGPRVNLHEAAGRWLEAKGLYSGSAGGLRRDRVFFERSRQDKSARIASEKCTHFIDDLPEMFREPSFPSGVQRMLYDPSGRAAEPGVACFRGWDEITSHFRSLCCGTRA